LASEDGHDKAAGTRPPFSRSLSVQGTFLNEIPDRSGRAFLCVPTLSARSSNIGLGVGNRV